MKFILQPSQLLVLVAAGWLNRRDHQVIDYPRTENEVLKEIIGKRRIRLNDDQRRRLSVKARVIGRKLLEQIGTLVTPDTLIRWHRLLVAQKWDYSAHRQPGRPPVAEQVCELVVRLARENPRWGYDRIQGALANLGCRVSDSTVANILREHGIEPAPKRKRTTTWKTFIKAHLQVLAAVDFTTFEVWTQKGLVTLYLLFAMEPASRKVHFAGCTTTPDEVWMKQVAAISWIAMASFVGVFARSCKTAAAGRCCCRRVTVNCYQMPTHKGGASVF